MAYLGDPIDATLAAAAGDDPELFRALGLALAESARAQFDLLKRARCDANWRTAALRLKNLGASFNADALMALADEAVHGAPGDPVVLRRIAALLADWPT